VGNLPSSSSSGDSPELRSDRVDRFSGPEQVNHVVQPGTAMRKPGAPECVIGIDGHPGHAILREMDHLRIGTPAGRNAASA